MRFFLFAIVTFFCSNIDGKTSQTIYVFGDSHTFAFQNIPGCSVCHLGGITMHRIGRDKIQLETLPTFPTHPNPPSLKPGDAIVFATGVIDNYNHIYRQKILYGRDLDEIIRTLVINYIYALYFCFLKYPDVIKIVYNVIPPADLENAAKWGSVEEHILSAKKINSLLKTLCPLFGFEFLDVYDDYADERGILRGDLSDEGGSHIDNYQFASIQRKLTEILRKYP